MKYLMLYEDYMSSNPLSNIYQNDSKKLPRTSSSGKNVVIKNIGMDRCVSINDDSYNSLSEEKYVFDFIVGERINEKVDFEALKSRVKSAVKKGTLTTAILLKLFNPTFGLNDTEKAEIMEMIPDMEMLADVNDTTDVVSVEDAIKEITGNPQKFYNKLKSDTNYQKSIAKAFQGDNIKKLQDMRVKYFVDQGKATVSSSEIDELKGGKKIKDMVEYNALVDKYKGKTKVMSYDKSTPADEAVNETVKLIQKLVQEYKPEESSKENTADYEELMKLRKEMGID